MKHPSLGNSVSSVWRALLTISVLFVSGVPANCETAAPARTVDELAQMFDSAGCKECHEEIYGQWEKSHHARPLISMLGSYLKRVAKRKEPAPTIIKTDFPCFKCHLPQIKYGTDAVAKEISEAVTRGDKESLAKLNIGCLVCHREKAMVHGRPDKGAIYGGQDLPGHEGAAVRKSPMLKNSLMCGQCHGLGPVLDNPDMPVQCATLYGSYLHAYIPAGGSQTCQACHMKDGDHYMPPNFSRRDELSARLGRSLPMEVETLAYTYHPKEGVEIPMVVVKTRITSKAGHRIPDG